MKWVTRGQTCISEGEPLESAVVVAANRKPMWVLKLTQLGSPQHGAKPTFLRKPLESAVVVAANREPFVGFSN
jgi:hypothetical protein